MRDYMLRAAGSFNDMELCIALVDFWTTPGNRSGLNVWDDLREEKCVAGRWTRTSEEVDPDCQRLQGNFPVDDLSAHEG
jgi:hypothetical protein